MSIQDYTPAARIMEPETLHYWRTKKGLSQRDASRELGWARGSLGPAERSEGAPKYIALACAASILNIPPYGTEDWNRWYRRNQTTLQQLVPISKMRKRNSVK